MVKLVTMESLKYLERKSKCCIPLISCENNITKPNVQTRFEAYRALRVLVEHQVLKTWPLERMK